MKKYDIHSILTENIKCILNDKENYMYMMQKCVKIEKNNKYTKKD